MDQHAQPDRTTLLQSAWSVALSATMVECEQFIYFFIVVRLVGWATILAYMYKQKSVMMEISYWLPLVREYTLYCTCHGRDANPSRVLIFLKNQPQV